MIIPSLNVWHRGLALGSWPQPCTGRKITSLQEKQERCLAREDLSCLSWIQPYIWFRGTRERPYAMEKYYPFTHIFFLLHLKMVLFCTSVYHQNISPNMGLTVCVLCQTKPKAAPCGYSLLVSPKRYQF